MKPKNILYEKIWDSLLYEIKNGDVELADDLSTELGYNTQEINLMAEKIQKPEV